jgi:hypothetical protein
VLERKNRLLGTFCSQEIRELVLFLAMSHLCFLEGCSTGMGLQCGNRAGNRKGAALLGQGLQQQREGIPFF